MLDVLVHVGFREGVDDLGAFPRTLTKPNMFPCPEPVSPKALVREMVVSQNRDPTIIVVFLVVSEPPKGEPSSKDRPKLQKAVKLRIFANRTGGMGLFGTS